VLSTHTLIARYRIKIPVISVASGSDQSHDSTAKTITPVVIGNTGGPGTYSMLAIPTGLSINSVTGVISGTPTAVTSGTYTVRCTNSTGMGTTTIDFTVYMGRAQGTYVHKTWTKDTSDASRDSLMIPAGITITSFSSAGRPSGILLDATTGALYGKPADSGHATIVVSGTTTAGTRAIDTVTFISTFKKSSGISRILMLLRKLGFGSGFRL
jgi:hypothetical protein